MDLTAENRNSISVEQDGMGDIGTCDYMGHKGGGLEEFLKIKRNFFCQNFGICMSN